jgi:hypothetical protein
MTDETATTLREHLLERGFTDIPDKSPETFWHMHKLIGEHEITAYREDRSKVWYWVAQGGNSNAPVGLGISGPVNVCDDNSVGLACIDDQNLALAIIESATALLTLLPH